MLAQFCLFCFNFRFAHRREGKNVAGDIEGAELEILCHGETLGGAHRRAQSTKAALAHVDVELRGVYALGRAVGSFSKFFRRLDRFDRDAIHRTDFRTFIAYNAVVDFIV